MTNQNIIKKISSLSSFTYALLQMTCHERDNFLPKTVFWVQRGKQKQPNTICACVSECFPKDKINIAALIINDSIIYY